MFTSVQVNRFLFRVKERPQGNTIVAQKTVQSKRICLYVCYIPPIFFLVQLSEGSSVWLQSLDFAGSLVLFSELPYNLTLEFFM